MVLHPATMPQRAGEAARAWIKVLGDAQLSLFTAGICNPRNAKGSRAKESSWNIHDFGLSPTGAGFVHAPRAGRECPSPISGAAWPWMLKPFRALQLSQWLFLSQPSSLRLYQPLSPPKHSPCSYRLGDSFNFETGRASLPCQLGLQAG